MSMSTLKSSQNTAARETEIRDLFCGWQYEGHENMSPVFEHGQWWIVCSPCGASWSVCDAEGPGTVNGYCLEQIDQGDESCLENTLEREAQ